MSISTTSGRRRRASCTAARPSPASPGTSSPQRSRIVGRATVRRRPVRRDGHRSLRPGRRDLAGRAAPARAHAARGARAAGAGGRAARACKLRGRAARHGAGGGRRPGLRVRGAVPGRQGARHARRRVGRLAARQLPALLPRVRGRLGLYAVATLRARVLSRAGAWAVLSGAVCAIMPSPTASSRSPSAPPCSSRGLLLDRDLELRAGGPLLVARLEPGHRRASLRHLRSRRGPAPAAGAQERARLHEAPCARRSARACAYPSAAASMPMTALPSRRIRDSR
jgi:hypothetical protein